MRLRMVLPVLLLAACSGEGARVTTAPPLPSAAPPTTAAEALFPLSGNAGYDVERYDVELAYDPATGAIVAATAFLTALALTDLAQVPVDFGTLALDGATVDGVPVVALEQAGGKVRVTPTTPLAAGARFVLAIAYHGVPVHRADPSLGSPLGWISSPTGSYVRDEPNGTSTWLPSNDHPSDKALYRLRISVPEPFFAVANGTPVAEEYAGGRVASTWEMPQPMAPHELQIAVGQFRRVDSATPAGLPLVSYIAQSAGDLSSAVGLSGEMLDFYAQLFGPYPFAAAGLIAADCPGGVSIDAQTRPLVSAVDLTGPPGPRQQGVLSTALAHQWFGAAVTPARWQDVWLSDGFATYARWLWMEHAGLQRVDDAAANALARTDALRRAFGPPDAPSAATLFSPAVVDGGAVVLHALRLTVGDAKFFEILRTWVATHIGASVTTDTFIDHASDVVGEDLTRFFMTWLSATDVPDEYPTPPGG